VEVGKRVWKYRTDTYVRIHTHTPKNTTKNGYHN
jgi:hypothetical protein